jgi:hypothetical protein
MDLAVRINTTRAQRQQKDHQKILRRMGKIVANDPAIQQFVPYKLHQDLDDVIDLRIKDTKIWRPFMHLDLKVRKSYDSHWAFIEKLKELKRVLRAGENRHNHSAAQSEYLKH